MGYSVSVEPIRPGADFLLLCATGFGKCGCIQAEEPRRVLSLEGTASANPPRASKGFHMVWVGVLRVFLVWAVPVLLLLAIRSETGQHRAAKEAGDGKVVFELDQRTYWAWLALFVYLLYAIVIQFGGGPFRGRSLVVAFVLAVLAVGLMAPFPETITSGPDGLMQEVRFFLKKKRIAWDDVREVRPAKKNKLLIVTGADGTRVIHTRQLPDRDRLLEELCKRCGDKIPKELRPVTVVVADMAGSAAVDADPAADA